MVAKHGRGWHLEVTVQLVSISKVCLTALPALEAEPADTVDLIKEKIPETRRTAHSLRSAIAIRLFKASSCWIICLKQCAPEYLFYRQNQIDPTKTLTGRLIQNICKTPKENFFFAWPAQSVKE